MNDKLERFDDLFKMSMTTLAITLTFGSKFFAEWGMRYAGIVLVYLLCLGIWGVGHLKKGTWEVVAKLWSWFFLVYMMPTIYASMITIGTSAELQLVPPHYALVASIVGFFLYWLIYRYLRELLERDRSTRFLTGVFPFLIIVSMQALNFFNNYFR
jgi:hypothetical protein